MNEGGRVWEGGELECLAHTLGSKEEGGERREGVGERKGKRERERGWQGWERGFLINSLTRCAPVVVLRYTKPSLRSGTSLAP